MSKSLELRQERAELVRQMCALTNSPADASRWKELNEKQEALRLQIQTTENGALTAEMEAMPSVASRQLPPVGDPGSYSSAERGETRRVALTPDEEKRSTPEYKAAFEQYIRTGEKRDYTALGSVSPADGFTLVPVGFQRELEARLKSYAGMRQACRILTTATGGPLQWPTVDDTGVTGEFIAENEPVNQENPTFDNVTLGSALCSSKQVLVPVQLLQDSAFNVESELAGMFAIRIGRALNEAYTNGTTPIVGLLPALVTATGRSVAAVGANSNTGVSGDTDINSIGSDDFSNVIAAVDPAYRIGAAFMAHTTIWDTVRKLKDKYGRPVWEVSLAQGEPDKVYGYPWFVNQAMASAIQANAKTLLFGNFAKYIIRDVAGITVVRFSELFMSSHQVGFQAFLRTEGKLLQAAAFAFLQHPAS
ncbi:MAG: phage major capsid protein [Terriglobales bacterium]